MCATLPLSMRPGQHSNDSLGLILVDNGAGRRTLSGVPSLLPRRCGSTGATGIHPGLTCCWFMDFRQLLKLQKEVNHPLAQLVLPAAC